MTRREVLAMAGTAAAWLPADSRSREDPAGGASGGFQRTPSGRRADLGFIPHGGALPRDRAGGRPDDARGHELEPAKELRKKVEGYGMQLILNVPTLPGGEDQAFKFGVALEACKRPSLLSARRDVDAALEQYDSLERFARTSNGFRIPLRSPSQCCGSTRSSWPSRITKTGARGAGGVAQTVTAKWVGVCLDLRTNIALCEDPMDPVKMLAPHTIMCTSKTWAWICTKTDSCFRGGDGRRNTRSQTDRANAAGTRTRHALLPRMVTRIRRRSRCPD